MVLRRWRNDPHDERRHLRELPLDGRLVQDPVERQSVHCESDAKPSTIDSHSIRLRGENQLSVLRQPQSIRAAVMNNQQFLAALQERAARRSARCGRLGQFLRFLEIHILIIITRK